MPARARRCLPASVSLPVSAYQCPLMPTSVRQSLSEPAMAARRSTTTADAQVHHRASSPPRRARRAAITADAQMHDHGGRAGSWRRVNPRSDSAYLPTLTVELAPRSTIGFYLPTRTAGLTSWLTFTFISIYAHGGACAWFKSTFIFTAAAGLARIYIRRYPRAQRRRGADS
jgi:hypothetical protein